MQAIRTYFEKNITISDEDWLLFSGKLQKRIFPKNTLLLKMGQKENFLSFIEEGTVRFYIPTGTDNELTFAFTFAGNFVSGYDSFITQQASGYNIESLTECITWGVSYNELQHIYAKSQAGNIIGRYAAEDLFLKKAKRELSLLNDSAEQRYLNLFKEQPHFIKHIPLKYLASYIGITPQALSRIRNRIS